MNPLAQAEAERAGALYGLTCAEVLEHGRGKSKDEARAIAAWSLRQRYGFSFPELGRYLNRDHTSVMSAVRRVERELRDRPWSIFSRNARSLVESVPAAAE